MIQRIQTVYLLIIVALMIATLFLPLTVLQAGESLCSFDASGISTMLTDQPELLYPTWGLFALTAIIAMLGFYGLYAFYVWTVSKDLGDVDITGKIALTFPFISLILNYLAIRNIGADEVLVRSLDRLR